MFPQPLWRAPRSLLEFTPRSLESLVLKAGEEKERERDAAEGGAAQPTTWAVLYYASWASPSIHMLPVFSLLARRYETRSMCFGAIDVSPWPHVATARGLSTSIPCAPSPPSTFCQE